MAKKALINKANRKPKFEVRGYTRCQRCGRPHSVFRKFGLCRICLREMAHAGELPGVTQVQLVSPAPVDARTTATAPPIADRPMRQVSETQRPRNRGERGTTRHDDDRPDRGHAHASAQRQPGVPRLGVPCRRSKLKTHIAEILQQEGYIAGWTVNDVEGRPAPARAGRRPEVRPQPGAQHRRRPARLQARPAGLREVDRPAQGARRPGRGDHLHVDRAADRPAGEQEGRGRGSPRLRLVRERANMSRIGRLPIPVPGGVDVTIDGQHGHASRARRARSSHTVAAPITRRARRGRHAAGAAARRRAAEPRAARPVPHADRQHGHRRHRGLHQDPRDRRRRLPRRRHAARTSSSPWASATRCR